MVNSRTDEIIIKTLEGSGSPRYNFSFDVYLLATKVGSFDLEVKMDNDCPSYAYNIPEPGVDQTYWLGDVGSSY